MEDECFRSSGIRTLILSSSVASIGGFAFWGCENLGYADLSAAHGLKSIEEYTFYSCKALKEVLLNDGLETIGEDCFEDCGLERVSIPGSVRYLDKSAFGGSSLTQVHFLGRAGNELRCGLEPLPEHFSGNVDNNCQTSERGLVIGKWAFSDCKSLRQIVFDPGSAVVEIQRKAFRCSGLESFIAPPSLRRIGGVAFSECCNLKTFELNEGIQEIGWFCLWRAGVTDLHLPPHVQMTREQLGLD